MSKRKQQEQGRRERLAAMRQEQEQRERRQKLVIFGTTGVILAALVVGTGWAVTQQGSEKSTSASTPPGELPKVEADGQRTDPPWQLPTNPVPAAEAAGLRVAPMEGTNKHFHAHLDVLVEGEPVQVPANMGIHPTGNAMSELHTHDDSGILHVEAPTDDMRYTLGQVFAEWDVRLDSRGVSGLEVGDGKTLEAYVDGERVKRNPANIELLEHRQIALVYGDKDAKVDVPDSYDFGQL